MSSPLCLYISLARLEAIQSDCYASTRVEETYTKTQTKESMPLASSARSVDIIDNSPRSDHRHPIPPREAPH